MTPLRSVTQDEVDTFWRDGVVCLRGIIDPEYVRSMAVPLAAMLGTPELADLSAMGDALAASGKNVLRDSEGEETKGRFVAGVDHWLTHSEFADFALRTCLPTVAAVILGSRQVSLWEDSVLAKEPGTAERTAWHQDLPYFHVEGKNVCTMWCPLDKVTQESGAVKFVKSSHLWPDVYRPNFFVSTMSIPGSPGEDVPDIDAMAAEGSCEILTFDTDPGDVTIHHARTIHGAGANTSDRWRRAISLRYCGDNVVYHERPGTPLKPHHVNFVEGAPLHPVDCPAVQRS